MKAILLTSSALLIVSGLTAAQAQDAEACPAEIDAFTRDYEEAMAAFGANDALSSSEQSELFGLRTTAENQYRAGNLEMCLEAIARARLMLETAIAPTALDPRELVGMEVRNAQDEYLGEIDGVTLDPMSGRIAYLLVEHGGFLGIGDSLTPVPWRAVTWSPGAEALLLDINEERLENAPRNLDEQVTPQERRGWLLSVHSYFGVEPYWQDNFPTMSMAAEPSVAAEPTSEASGAAGAPDSGTGAAEAGSGEQANVVAVEPEPAEAEAAAEPGQAAAAGDDATAAAEAGGGDATGAGDGTGGMDAVMSRLDDLENRIQEISQQGVGEEVRQAIGDLEARVQELAQQDPGEEVRSAIADLQERVQAMAEQAPGEEIRGAISSLESRVEELAQSAPGQELREMMARMETEIRQLSAGGAGSGTAANFAGGAGGSGSGTAASAASGEQPRTAAATGGSEADQGSGQGQVIVIRPEDVQIIEPGAAEAESGAETAGTEPAAGTEQAAAEPAEAAGGQGAPAMPAMPEAEPGAQVGETAAIDQEQPAAGEGAATAAAGTEAPDAAEADDEGQAAMARPGELEPCDAAIARLAEDLARAEEAGLSVDEAQNDLAAAQAMLNRDSQALCRAAIKRALDELVAQGFEPAQAAE